SSTSAAIIEEINHSRKAYIITVEDPIEYVFANDLSIIEQREIGRDTNNFEDALKYFQEEDGDVLFLEQLSKPEVIPLALDIASGNSLVITTMAADTAGKAVASILDSFTSFDQDRIRDMLARSLKAVVCQKIIPKIGGGLKAICEILLVNDTVKATIAKGNVGQLEDIVQTSRKEGMISFNQALLDAVRKGEISSEDAVANSPDPQGLEKLTRQ
ncbi:MAG: ATPase, T2SS/T4P/T4SS family, partial [Patescibacteria group bacterium]